MTTPNKIYIQASAHDGWFEGNKPNDNFVEYIRKDALLKWAKKNEKRLSDLLTPTTQSLILGGKLYAFQEFIEKIESL